MRTLAIETTTEACSVALFDGEAMDLVDARHETIGRGHAERLVPMIADLPDRGQAARICVSLGPGSFTGVRIGIAAARALGIAWRSQVLGFPTLGLVAASATADASRPVTVCMHGGHGQWFVQSFDASLLPEDEVASLTPEQARDRVRHPTIAGNRAQDLARLLPSASDVQVLLPDARLLGLLDASRFITALAPIYGRAPDAKLPQ